MAGPERDEEGGTVEKGTVMVRDVGVSTMSGLAFPMAPLLVFDRPLCKDSTSQHLDT